MYSCLNCQTKFTFKGVQYTHKYCNNVCQKEFEYKEAIRNWDTVTPGGGRIKRYLADTFGKKCSKCGIDSWNNEPIVLELEHIDGNSENNSKTNVCLLCPNCHSHRHIKQKTKAMVDIVAEPDTLKAKAFSTNFRISSANLIKFHSF